MKGVLLFLQQLHVEEGFLNPFVWLSWGVLLGQTNLAGSAKREVNQQNHRMVKVGKTSEITESNL